MKSALILLFPLLAVHAITTQSQVRAATPPTPPEFDPKSKVCPGNCYGTYFDSQLAKGNCLFGTAGMCLCDATLASPPLGDLNTCLQGPTCKMSAADTQNYTAALLKFEGCTHIAESTHIDTATTSTTGPGGQSGLPLGSAPPASESFPNGADIAYSTHSGGRLVIGLFVTLAGVSLSTMLV
ncbi:hypothetical protein C8R43DRAFT_49591 [Mycena crocata]|nr:hypothetical protein C8R43DRAFT_49591 [Mycena crocata]